MSGAGRRRGRARSQPTPPHRTGPHSTGAPRSRRDWGWHRLEPDWADRVVDRSDLRPGQLVIELGAGTGALTGPLLDRGVDVIAVELHAGRAERLRRAFRTDRLRVVELDAREFRLPARPFRVVSSPPYGLTADLVSLITQRSSRLFRADLVLQQGAVNRYLSRPIRRFSAERGITVPRRAFAPPPRVDSAVLTLRRR